ncbi:AAA family ATPase [Brevibacillus dissolubilis]|uniref:AAA family ATPase n=1 Tax=Brevibacillus dissolubilis TaxID=1844116 RepID=UPI0011177D5C|nr:AAA family ATPase [Brevibacillus dissolubilis]
MEQRWTLVVEDFARIEKAEIEIAPFMMFVGENNSGKSYVMSLLWGMMTGGNVLFPDTPPKSETYHECRDWLKSNLSLGEVKVDEQTQQLFVRWFNELVRDNSQHLLLHIFNNPFKMGKLEVKDYRRANPLYFQIQPDERIHEGTAGFDLTVTHMVKILVNPKNAVLTEESILSIAYQLTWHIMFEGMTRLYYKHSLADPLYLPASRTGFMLSYKKILGDMFDRRYIVMETNPKYREDTPFSCIVYDFLSRLLKLNLKRDGTYQQIAEFLEKEIIKGTIKQDQSPVPNFLYVPLQSEEVLPLHVTSSVVAELSPLILFLRSSKHIPLLIIEEPEAHLHIELQRLLTRALIRLYNKSVPVWITTHSDTVFQQMNNSIAVEYLGQKFDFIDTLQKFNYHPDDLLKRGDTRVYQFTIQPNGKTKAELLPTREEGFVVPTFNQPLWDLSQEVLKIQEMMSDVE